MENNETRMIRTAIKTCVDKNITEFVILPFGKWGQEVKSILNKEFGIIEKFCFDNNLYDMKHIFPIKVELFKKTDRTVFLIAVMDIEISCKMRETLLKYVPDNQILDVFHEEEWMVFHDDSKVRLDFLCVGFPKCGTTSLDAALRKNPSVFLPVVKESQFLNSISLNSHNCFKRLYPKEKPKDKVIGEIEPIYYDKPYEVFKYFGNDLKLIFCVRNPVQALYSNFKMSLNTKENMEKFGTKISEAFDKWEKSNRHRYKYSVYIKEFLKYYTKEQIGIVINEELRQNTLTEMDDLQNFIGLPEEKRIEYHNFPHANRGKIPKDFISAYINGKLREIEIELRTSDYELLVPLKETRRKIWEITMKECDEKMLQTTHDRLLHYYMDSIHELEEIVGKSLQGGWY